MRVFAFEAAVEITGTTTMRRVDLLDEPHRRDLALVLVAVVAARDEDRGAVAVRDRRDRDEAVRPAAGVRDFRVLQTPDLLPGRGQVDRRGDGRFRHDRESRTVVTAASVASSNRSASLCA
jgi:hypothetical protein